MKQLNRTVIGRLTWACLILSIVGRAQDTHYAAKGQLIPAPECLAGKAALTGSISSACTPGTHAEWLRDIGHWRDERRIRVGYSGQRYAEGALAWAQSSFLQPQMMVHDRYFYDPAAGRYTVDRYLDDLEKRYGGIDSVLIWPTYPNMGIDDRNQHDMIRAMPGGVAGVKRMVDDFHKRHVRVLFPMMMWDQGTRDQGKPWPDAIAELMKEIDADGINGDTQDGVPLAFALAAEKAEHMLAFEPENTLSDEAVAWDVMNWGQYGGQFTFVPGVDRYRWLEPRHMVNISDRWNRSKTDDLQYAFFNGEGWVSWENVWGIWNGMSERDSEATRRVAAMERTTARFLTSAEWEPHFPMAQHGVFASRWPLGGETVWTIVNRNEYACSGRQLAVKWQPGMRYFDLYHGHELTAERAGEWAFLSFAMEAHGYGAVLATASDVAADMRQLMEKMRALTAKPLSSYAAEWKMLPQRMVEMAATKQAKSAPENMVRIAGGDYDFRVQGIEIEGSNDIGVDVQYPWEDAPRRFHEHRLHIKTFYMDKYPVTNAQFKQFVDASQYRPADGGNFLRGWTGGAFAPEDANRPVTWISQEDARAYARWAGKRLPHEWEWQYAAQGQDGRAYPWGNEWRAEAVPVAEQGRQWTGPDRVDAHSAGTSPFGVMDMVGNVWQWTDEYTDEHTRAGILRGGSRYQAQGSMWYFPQAYRNDQHGKLLLMAPGYDRAGTLGFRCVMDAAE